MGVASIASKNSQATHLTAYNILLPFPNNIQIGTEYVWSAEEMGVAADLVKAHGRGNVTQDDLKNAMQRAGLKIADTLGGNANSAYSHINNRALNPKEEMLFRGVNYRTFSLNWNLVPTTAAESNAYANAIEILHKMAAPELTSTEAFFKYPETTKVFVQKAGGKVIIDRGDCAITNISVDLTPDGIWAQLKDGRPVNTGLQIDFVELKLPTKDNTPKLLG
ncbi:MAG: hypothetical protein QM489_01000 [Candidatus Izemoplasma sp.]